MSIYFFHLIKIGLTLQFKAVILINAFSTSPFSFTAQIDTPSFESYPFFTKWAKIPKNFGCFCLTGEVNPSTI
jgi:hypothetical protein